MLTRHAQGSMWRMCAPMFTPANPTSRKNKGVKGVSGKPFPIGFAPGLRVCGLLFFLYYLQAFELLESEAHYAALLALVLEVDGLVVVVDHDLRGHPAAVVKPLCPLGDVLVDYLLGLLAHPRLLLSSLVFVYPE